jgi:hypothetical protein
MTKQCYECKVEITNHHRGSCYTPHMRSGYFLTQCSNGYNIKEEGRRESTVATVHCAPYDSCDLLDIFNIEQSCMGWKHLATINKLTEIIWDASSEIMDGIDAFRDATGCIKYDEYLPGDLVGDF